MLRPDPTRPKWGQHFKANKIRGTLSAWDRPGAQLYQMLHCFPLSVCWLGQEHCSPYRDEIWASGYLTSQSSLFCRRDSWNGWRLVTQAWSHGVGSGWSCSAILLGWVSSCPPAFVLLTRLRTYLVSLSFTLEVLPRSTTGARNYFGSILYSLGLKLQGLVAVSVYYGQRCLIGIPVHHWPKEPQYLHPSCEVIKKKLIN